MARVEGAAIVESVRILRGHWDAAPEHRVGAGDRVDGAPECAWWVVWRR
jgi:hypothetical protein